MNTKENDVGFKGSLRTLFDRLVNLPVIVWVLASFLVVYIFFFASPVFLNDGLNIQYPSDYLPNIQPIGNDLSVLIKNTKGWFYENKSPYYVHFYPPFTFLFFSPLLLLNNYPQTYNLFTLISIASYFLLAFLAAKMLRKRNEISILILLFITGLFSYGFQFELERGQYDLLAFLFCIWGIYLFHNHPKQRLLAYLLFSISIQLKLYPAIFIVLFVENWKDWKNNILRFAGIGIFNFLLLFVMGYDIFLEFMASASKQLFSPEWIWNGNHSIKSFVEMLSRDGFNIIRPGIVDSIRLHAGLLSNLILIAFLVSFAFSIFVGASKKQTGIDSFLLLNCMIGALIIPVSNDYKLSLLTIPMILFLSNIPTLKNRAHQVIAILLTIGISISYFLTLIPYKYKSYYLSNTFPLLFLILILLTAFDLIRFLDFKFENNVIK